MWRQEIVSAGNAVYYSERMLPTLSFSDATEWDADYAVIKNANFLETACNRMSDGEFSGNRRAEVLGEIAIYVLWPTSTSWFVTANFGI